MKFDETVALEEAAAPDAVELSGNRRGSNGAHSASSGHPRASAPRSS
jgi:hypothetical protein